MPRPDQRRANGLATGYPGQQVGGGGPAIRPPPAGRGPGTFAGRGPGGFVLPTGDLAGRRPVLSKPARGSPRAAAAPRYGTGGTTRGPAPGRGTASFARLLVSR